MVPTPVTNSIRPPVPPFAAPPEILMCPPAPPCAASPVAEASTGVAMPCPA